MWRPFQLQCGKNLENKWGELHAGHSGQILQAILEKYNIRRERDFRGGIVATFTTAVWQWEQQQQVRTNPPSAARTQTGFGKDDITTQECVCMVCAIALTVRL